jgi:hypothetical protein
LHKTMQNRFIDSDLMELNTYRQANDIMLILKIAIWPKELQEKEKMPGQNLPHALKHPALSIQGFNWEENPARRWQ